MLTVHGEESALDEVTVLVEETVAELESVAPFLEQQSRSEAGRRWPAAAGSSGEGGRGIGQKLGCLGSVGGSRRGFSASCMVYQKKSRLSHREIIKHRDHYPNDLVRGASAFWGGGERVKSAGEPEGRIGELWGSPRPMIGSTMSGKLGFT